jgi:superfamily I DNA and RNA helicase
MLQTSITSDSFSKNTFANQFVDYIELHQEELALAEGVLYYEFPMFKEINEEILFPSFCIISPSHGVLFIVGDDRTQRTLNRDDLEILYKRSDQLYNLIFSKLLKIPKLRKKGRKNDVLININICLFLPNFTGSYQSDEFDYIDVLTNYDRLKEWLNSQVSDKVEDEHFKLLCAVLDGTYGLPKLKDRNITEENKNSKGGILEELEKEIAIFDHKQKIAALTQIDGLQRIRGFCKGS